MTLDMASRIEMIEEVLKAEHKLEEMDEMIDTESVCFTDAVDALDKCIIVLATELVDFSKKDTIYEKGTF